MITHLHLKNLILIDSGTLSFAPQFTALTGETGAGKTALLEGIRLILGARADTQLIRQGEEKACVEAAFHITSLKKTQSLLQAAGISFSLDEDLIIRREITREGKNRAFINGHLVTLAFLQEIGATLIEIIGQHAHHTLTGTDTQRMLLDEMDPAGAALLASFQIAFQTQQRLQGEIKELKQQEQLRQQQETFLSAQLHDMQSLRLTSSEEDELTQAHRRLAQAHETGEKLQLMNQALSTFLPQLGKFHKTSETLLTDHPLLQHPTSLLHEAWVTLSETLRELQRYIQTLEQDSFSFQQLEERLRTLHAIKRKYHLSPTLSVFEHLQQSLGQWDDLQQNQVNLETKQADLLAAEQETADRALRLTQYRYQVAHTLSHALTQQLQALNMPGAEVKICIEPAPRSLSGDDLVQFKMRANIGQPILPIADYASGGELSRLLLALKLHHHATMPTLIFDEIDANVGGTTAKLIGNLLKTLGHRHQILCITHFSQVAQEADHHIQVQKKEVNGRTVTILQTLDSHEKEKELLRMLGQLPI